MNTIDRPIGWTTIDEAKRLMAANVDLNSADMSFVEGPSGWTLSASPSLAVQKKLFSFRQGYELPCWSLGALLDLLPKEILPKDGSKSYLIATEGIEHPWTLVYADCDNNDVPGFAFQKDTLVEACIEMIIALKVAEKEGNAFVPWPQDNVKGGE